MIDERKIDDKGKYGTQYDVGNITLYVTCKFWGSKWETPTILLGVTYLYNKIEVKYETCEAIAAAFTKASQEWERLWEWKNEKNLEISKKLFGANQTR